MSDKGAGSGLPESVGAGLAPGSLVAVLVVDGVVADYVPLTHENTEIGGAAIKHAGASLSAADAGLVAVVGIYDGDSGELVALIGTLPS